MLTSSRGVGFLNYWTFGNLPLFLLAIPMLYILCISGNWARIASQRQAIIQDTTPKEGSDSNQKSRSKPGRTHDIPWRLAIPQVALAILGLTTYHVQIITRLSSGYPVWYWWLAFMIIEEGGTIEILPSNVKLGPLLTRWMVIYALIQGALFASFLPPA